jgi:hypothetical protein
MSSHSWLFTGDDIPVGAAKSLAIQRRTDEIAAEMFARVEKRRLAFEELRSTLYSPRDRINAWEKLHGLQLPFDSKHPILLSIADSTGLTLAQVCEEQEARNDKTATPVHSPGVIG